MNKSFLSIVRHWLPIGVAISALVCIIFLVIQQSIRIGGYDPQIQFAEDTAVLLESGQTPNLGNKIPVDKSLAPFTIIYDKQGNIVSTNADLHGQTPKLPPSVLTAHKGTDIANENRLTWQPQEGTRLATIVVTYSKGYVVVGRNMRELETRIEQQFGNIMIGWIAAMVATFSCVAVVETTLKERK